MSLLVEESTCPIQVLAVSSGSVRATVPDDEPQTALPGPLGCDRRRGKCGSDMGKTVGIRGTFSAEVEVGLWIPGQWSPVTGPQLFSSCCLLAFAVPRAPGGSGIAELTRGVGGSHPSSPGKSPKAAKSHALSVQLDTGKC